MTSKNRKIKSLSEQMLGKRKRKRTYLNGITNPMIMSCIFGLTNPVYQPIFLMALLCWGCADA